jgi:hypothetical protein
VNILRFRKAPKEALSRADVINALIVRYGYRSYLEIGVNTPAQPGWSHDSIQVETKHGVDPNPAVEATFPVTSDEFFERHVSRRYDIVFVDGLHLFEQAYRDIVNALAWLNENGTIVVHDTRPEKEITQRRERASDAWHGDVWKAILKLRLEAPELEIFTVDTDEGCTVIRRGAQPLLQVADPPEDMYTWDFYEQHRDEILQLVDVQEFRSRLGTAAPE